MPKVIILGTANAVPDRDHENTHMAIVSDERVILVDCVGNPILRLPEAGIKFDQIADLVLTHFHPDHVSSVPLLLMDMWLMGRKEPLQVWGLAHTLDRMEEVMGFYNWDHWPNFFPVRFNRLPEEELTLAINWPELKIYTSPVRHLIPTIGLRMEACGGQKVFAYSCDTEPCPEVERLAKDADILIHEATGASTGHSSAAQAGEIARKARAKALYLIHYQAGGFDASQLSKAAGETYGQPVQLARDFMTLDLSCTD